MKSKLPKLPQGMPTPQQVLDFIQSSDIPAGKREIAKAFGLKGQEKIKLKALLKDMAEDGLIDGKKSAFHRMGGVPNASGSARGATSAGRDGLPRTRIRSSTPVPSMRVT